jgi:hypothetical protein
MVFVKKEKENYPNQGKSDAGQITVSIKLLK